MKILLLFTVFLGVSCFASPADFCVVSKDNSVTTYRNQETGEVFTVRDGGAGDPQYQKCVTVTDAMQPMIVGGGGIWSWPWATPPMRQPAATAKRAMKRMMISLCLSKNVRRTLSGPALLVVSAGFRAADPAG